MFRAEDRKALEDQKAPSSGGTRPMVHLAAVHLAVDGGPVASTKVALLLQELREVGGKVRAICIAYLTFAQRPHDAHAVHVDEPLVKKFGGMHDVRLSNLVQLVVTIARIRSGLLGPV